MQLTNAQKEYFENSSIRNESGQLLICQHGTNANFDSFNPEMIGDDNKLGYGFYFTAGEDLTMNYDYKVFALIDIRNPITEQSNLLTEDKMKEFCDKLNIDMQFERRSHSDIDKYTALCDSYNGSKTKFLNTMKEVFGVDGVYSKDRKSVVAFHSNQIKSIGNKYPTKSDNFRDNTNEYLKTNFNKLSVKEHIELAKKVKLSRHNEREMNERAYSR